MVSNGLAESLGGPLVVENTKPGLEGLVKWAEEVCPKHRLKDVVALVEMTGRYHRSPRNVLKKHWTVGMPHSLGTATPGTSPTLNGVFAGVSALRAAP